MSKLDQLREKLAREQAARDAASSALSEDDRAELELRRSIKTASEERAKAERDALEIDLDRREDAAREANPGAQIVSLIIDGYPDSFVLMHAASAFRRWETEIAKAATNKKIDKAQVSLNYAVDAVIDWNGCVDFSAQATTNALRLREYLGANPGIVTAIVSAAAELAGIFSEVRKR